MQAALLQAIAAAGTRPTPPAPSPLYPHAGHFRQVALRQVAHAIAGNPTLVGELRRQFEALDVDGDLKITHEQVGS